MARVVGDADALIAEHIEPHPARDSLTEARVKGKGVPVWALIARYRLTPGADAAERVACAYRVSDDAMAAALAYYRQHKSAIDARLAALEAE